MKKLFIIAPAVLAILVAALLLFLSSGFFLPIIENYASSRMNQPVHIGSVRLEKGYRIFVRDVTVTEKERGDTGIFIPETLIVLSLRGVMKRTIDELVIVKPEVRLTYGSKRKVAHAWGKPSLPVKLKKAIVRDAGVIVNLNDDRSFQLKDLNIDLNQPGRDGVVEIKATAAVPGLASKADARALADIDKLKMTEANITISGVDLNALSKVMQSKETGDVWTKGTAEIGIDILREETGRVEWKTGISLRDFSAGSSSFEVKPGKGPVTLISEGGYGFKSGEVDIRLCKLQIAELGTLQLSGRIKNVFSEIPDIALDMQTDFMPLHELKRSVSGHAVKQLEEFDFQATGKVTLSATGKFNAPELNADVHIKGDYIRAYGIRLKDFKADIPIHYGDNSFIAGKVSVHTALASFYGNTGEIISDSDIYLKGGIEANIEPVIVRLKNLTVHTGSVKDITGEVIFRQNKGSVVYSSLSWKDPDIHETARRLFPSVFKDKGFNIHGSCSVKTEVRMTSGNNGDYTVSGTARMSISNAGFLSSDETKIGEGIQSEISGGFNFHVPFEAVDFNVQANASGFELLAGKFYGNFEDRVFSYSGKGRYTRARDKLIISDSSGSLSGIGNINFTGDISGPWDSPLIDGVLRLANISNRDAFNFFVRDTFQEQVPFLSDMEIDGQSSADLFIKGSPREFTVRGQVNVRDMNVHSEEKDSGMKGVQIYMPFDLSYPEAAKAPGGGEYGLIRIEDITLGILKLENVVAFPAVRRNALIFREDIGIKLLGGDIMLGDVTYRDLLSPERELRLALRVSNINLAEAGGALDIPRFSGTLSGTIPSAVFSENRLVTEGEVVLEIFDGRVRISDLSIDNVFSPVTSFKSSIALEDINMEELTDVFDFGQLSGIITGEIRDLVIVNGQAQSFKARVATVKKKGIDQRISVEALKKISILGTGSSVTILDLGVYQFLRKYRYEKIGFTASLKNDNLILLGVDSKDGEEYLVKGGLIPPKVDVINHNQNVSFKEMVNRLKRIKQAGR